MGGSAWSADFAHAWLAERLPVPLVVVRDYDLPGYVDSDTLFIAASNSGNTEETLSALRDAERKGARIFAMAAGGKLIDIAKEKQYAFVQSPGGIEPRFAALYGVRIMAAVLEQAGLVPQALVELAAAQPFLESSVQSWLPDVLTAKNPAKELALELIGRNLVAYGAAHAAPAAYRWKMDFNENAKNVAFWNVYPEFNHNELTGWSSHPVDKLFAVVELRTAYDHPRITSRFDISDRLLSGRMPAPHVIEAAGKTRLEQLLWLSLFGDFVSIYAGLLNGVDPTPVPLAERLKQELQRSLSSS
jgi:glucose/mannose-6-phosphate isomerase